MTRHSDKVCLEHMLAHAREALHHAKGRSREDLPELVHMLEQAIPELE